MAFLAAIGAVGAMVGAMAGSGASKAQEQVKHRQTKLRNVLLLDEGDHISYRIHRDVFRHAIIAEQVTNNEQTVRVLYLENRCVQEEKLDIRSLIIRGEDVYVDEYDPLICYPKKEVAERARSLCRKYAKGDVSYEQDASIYCDFFDGERHFADWCQTGLSFSLSKVVRRLVSGDYRVSAVTDVASLRQGDHVAICAEGRCAIVVGDVGSDGRVDVVRFPAESRRNPEQVVIDARMLVASGRLLRLDYDIAVGFDGQSAKRNALRESTSTTDPLPFYDGEQFGVWCKTSTRTTASDLAKLAKARMLGRVYTQVRSAWTIRRGDHLSYTGNGGAVDYQHGIVTRVSGSLVHLVVLPSNVAGSNRHFVKVIRETIYVGEGKQIWKYFYGTTESGGVDEVARRAESCCDKTASELPFKDAEHFASWCKTGEYQLHGGRQLMNPAPPTIETYTD